MLGVMMTGRKRSYLDEGISNWRDYLRYLFLAVPAGLWWTVGNSVNSGEATLSQYYMMAMIAIAFIILISAFLVNYGSRNFGILSLSIGSGAFATYIRLATTYIPNPAQVAFVQSALLALMIFGETLILLGTVSIAMWLSSHVLARSSLTVRLFALAIAGASVLVWFWFIAIPATLTDSVVFASLVPSFGILLYIILIITSSFFFPRRQGITLFYFLLGLVLTLYGFSMFVDTPPLNTPFTFPVIVSLGTVLFTSTALPLGTGKTFYEHHPEHTIYIALTLWYILELVYFFNYPIYYGRIIAIAAIVMVAAALPRPRRSYVPIFACLFGAVLYAVGNIQWLFAHLPVPLPYNPFVALAGMVIGMGIFLYSLILIAASLRHIFQSHAKLTKYTRPLGWVFIILAFVLLSIVGLFTIFAYHIELGILALITIGSSIKFKRKDDPSGVPFGILLLATFLMLILAQSNLLPISLEGVFVSYYYTGILLLIMSGIEWKASESGDPITTEKKLTHKIRIRKVGGPEIEGGYPTKTAQDIPQAPPQAEVKTPPEKEEDTVLPEASTSEPQFSPEEPQGEESDAERMARTWYNRALKLYEVGEMDEAIKSIETALTWKSDHENARRFRKWLKEKSVEN